MCVSKGTDCGTFEHVSPQSVPQLIVCLLNATCFLSSCVCSGGLFSKTEMSEVLTEILKADPSFDKDSFLKQCERDIIPNILEVLWTANNTCTAPVSV